MPAAPAIPVYSMFDFLSKKTLAMLAIGSLTLWGAYPPSSPNIRISQPTILSFLSPFPSSEIPKLTFSQIPHFMYISLKDEV
jgi:hypothetical protein